MKKTSSKSQELDPRVHFVVATAIVVNKEGKYLIAKRADWEKAMPNKWTVPGGKMRSDEYKKAPLSYKHYNQQYNILKWVLSNELKNEVGLEIHPPQFLCDLVFVRPDGYPTVTLSHWARHKKGEVKLKDKSLTDYAWVNLKEAKKYDLIEGIWDEIKMVDDLLKKQKRK